MADESVDQNGPWVEFATPSGLNFWHRPGFDGDVRIPTERSATSDESVMYASIPMADLAALVAAGTRKALHDIVDDAGEEELAAMVGLFALIG